MNNHTMGPVGADQRLVHLDVLRGFALLGILLVNFEWFTRATQTMVLGPDPSLAGVGRVVDWSIFWLAEGKFYPLFSMLFGAGFALMAERARAQDAAFWRIYFRRILFLAGFGALHIALFWSGDVLLVYAFCALVMVLFFRNTPVRRLWKWALAMIVWPLLFFWLALGLITIAQQDPETSLEIAADIEADRATLMEEAQRTAAIHREGNFVDNLQERFRSYGTLLSYGGIYWLSFVLGFFMLGRWLVAANLLTQVSAHASTFRNWRRYGLVLGLALAAGATFLLYSADRMTLTPAVAWGITLATAASVILSLAYLSTVILSVNRLRWLAPAGRMALSNYLLQSIFWTSLFYGYGLGLWGQIPRAWHPLLVFAFFALQVAFSQWWLNRFRFGPAEWLWRCLTYWQRQPIRRVGE